MPRCIRTRSPMGEPRSKDTKSCSGARASKASPKRKRRPSKRCSQSGRDCADAAKIKSALHRKAKQMKVGGSSNSRSYHTKKKSIANHLSLTVATSARAAALTTFIAKCPMPAARQESAAQIPLRAKLTSQLHTSPASTSSRTNRNSFTAAPALAPASASSSSFASPKRHKYSPATARGVSHSTTTITNNIHNRNVMNTSVRNKSTRANNTTNIKTSLDLVTSPPLYRTWSAQDTQRRAIPCVAKPRPTNAGCTAGALQTTTRPEMTVTCWEQKRVQTTYRPQSGYFTLRTLPIADAAAATAALPTVKVVTQSAASSAHGLHTQPRHDSPSHSVHLPSELCEKSSEAGSSSSSSSSLMNGTKESNCMHNRNPSRGCGGVSDSMARNNNNDNSNDTHVMLSRHTDADQSEGREAAMCVSKSHLDVDLSSFNSSFSSEAEVRHTMSRRPSTARSPHTTLYDISVRDDRWPRATAVASAVYPFSRTDANSSSSHATTLLDDTVSSTVPNYSRHPQHTHTEMQSSAHRHAGNTDERTQLHRRELQQLRQHDPSARPFDEEGNSDEDEDEDGQLVYNEEDEEHAVVRYMESGVLERSLCRVASDANSSGQVSHEARAVHGDGSVLADSCSPGSKADTAARMRAKCVGLDQGMHTDTLTTPQRLRRREEKQQGSLRQRLQNSCTPVTLQSLLSASMLSSLPCLCAAEEIAAPCAACSSPHVCARSPLANPLISASTADRRAREAADLAWMHTGSFAPVDAVKANATGGNCTRKNASDIYNSNSSDSIATIATSATATNVANNIPSNSDNARNTLPSLSQPQHGFIATSTELSAATTARSVPASLATAAANATDVNMSHDKTTHISPAMPPSASPTATPCSCSVLSQPLPPLHPCSLKPLSAFTSSGDVSCALGSVVHSLCILNKSSVNADADGESEYMASVDTSRDVHPSPTAAAFPDTHATEAASVFADATAAVVSTAAKDDDKKILHSRAASASEALGTLRPMPALPRHFSAPSCRLLSLYDAFCLSEVSAEAEATDSGVGSLDVVGSKLHRQNLRSARAGSWRVDAHVLAKCLQYVSLMDYNSLLHSTATSSASPSPSVLLLDEEDRHSSEQWASMWGNSAVIPAPLQPTTPYGTTATSSSRGAHGNGSTRNDMHNNSSMLCEGDNGTMHSHASTQTRVDANDALYAAHDAGRDGVMRRHTWRRRAEFSCHDERADANTKDSGNDNNSDDSSRTNTRSGTSVNKSGSYISGKGSLSTSSSLCAEPWADSVFAKGLLFLSQVEPERWIAQQEYVIAAVLACCAYDESPTSHDSSKRVAPDMTHIPDEGCAECVVGVCDQKRPRVSCIPPELHPIEWVARRALGISSASTATLASATAATATHSSSSPTIRCSFEEFTQAWERQVRLVFCTAAPAHQRAFRIVPDGLTFSSDFESGSLLRVERTAEPFRYHLWLESDKGSDKRIWFRFAVAGAAVGRTLHFHLLNAAPHAKLYLENNMRPVWRDGASQFQWTAVDSCSFNLDNEGANGHVYFSVTARGSADTIQIAFCAPYTYADLLCHVCHWSALVDRCSETGASIQFHRKVLCYSPEGRKLHLLVITNAARRRNSHAAATQQQSLRRSRRCRALSRDGLDRAGELENGGGTGAEKRVAGCLGGCESARMRAVECNAKMRVHAILAATRMDSSSKDTISKTNNRNYSNYSAKSSSSHNATSSSISNDDSMSNSCNHVDSSSSRTRSNGSINTSKYRMAGASAMNGVDRMACSVHRKRNSENDEAGGDAKMDVSQQLRSWAVEDDAIKVTMPSKNAARTTMGTTTTAAIANNGNADTIHVVSGGGKDAAVRAVRGPYANFTSGKKVVLLSARVHPGEVTASHALHGFVSFVLSADPRAILLREHFIFFIVPMLNPDGVSRGHSRMDQYGNNLNRCYNDPDEATQPTVHALRRVFTNLQQCFRERFIMYIDFHSHASQSSAFMFGNCLPSTVQHWNMVFPRIVELHARDLFAYRLCRFSRASMTCKDGTSRVLFGGSLIHSYTIELPHFTNGVLYVDSVQSLTRANPLEFASHLNSHSIISSNNNHNNSSKREVGHADASTRAATPSKGERGNLRSSSNSSNTSNGGRLIKDSRNGSQVKATPLCGTSMRRKRGTNNTTTSNSKNSDSTPGRTHSACMVRSGAGAMACVHERHVGGNAASNALQEIMTPCVLLQSAQVGQACALALLDYCAVRGRTSNELAGFGGTERILLEVKRQMKRSRSLHCGSTNLAPVMQPIFKQY